MVEDTEQPEVRILTGRELDAVSGGTKNLLADIPLGISPAIDAFLSGYYSTCGCASTGHSANYQG
jgi:hypothetical protein